MTENETRAERAFRALLAYEGNPSPGRPAPDDKIGVMTDLLTDLLHWRQEHLGADALGTISGFERDARNARYNFMEEVRDADPDLD